MNFLLSFIVACCFALPWLAMAAVAGLAWKKQKTSKLLLLQAGGAILMFLAVMGHWAIVDILLGWLIHPDYRWIDAAGYIFSFMKFVALIAFAAGYCLEKFKKPAGAGFPVQ